MAHVGVESAFTLRHHMTMARADRCDGAKLRQQTNGRRASYRKWRAFASGVRVSGSARLITERHTKRGQRVGGEVAKAAEEGVMLAEAKERGASGREGDNRGENSEGGVAKRGALRWHLARERRAKAEADVQILRRRRAEHGVRRGQSAHAKSTAVRAAVCDIGVCAVAVPIGGVCAHSW